MVIDIWGYCRSERVLFSSKKHCNVKNSFTFTSNIPELNVRLIPAPGFAFSISLLVFLLIFSCIVFMFFCCRQTHFPRRASWLELVGEFEAVCPCQWKLRVIKRFRKIPNGKYELGVQGEQLPTVDPRAHTMARNLALRIATLQPFHLATFQTYWQVAYYGQIL